MKPTADVYRYTRNFVQDILNNGMKDAICKANCSDANPRYEILHWYYESPCSSSQPWNMNVGYVRAAFVFYNKEFPWVIKIRYNYNCNIIDEANCYRRLCKLGYGDCVVPTFKCGKVDGYEVTIQPYVDTMQESVDDYLGDYFDCTGRLSQYSPSSDEYWDACHELCDNISEEEMCIAAFGDVRGNNFFKILQRMHINDLHSGNWGVDDRGSLIIFDYAGYYDI